MSLLLTFGWYFCKQKSSTTPIKRDKALIHSYRFQQNKYRKMPTLLLYHITRMVSPAPLQDSGEVKKLRQFFWLRFIACFTFPDIASSGILEVRSSLQRRDRAGFILYLTFLLSITIACLHLNRNYSVVNCLNILSNLPPLLQTVNDFAIFLSHFCALWYPVK